MKNVKLPDKLSELLGLALDDLEKCEADPRYKIEMWQWHSPYRGRCAVCLTGSVIAQTFHAKSDEFLYPGLFAEDLTGKLRAINFLRMGNVDSALCVLANANSSAVYDGRHPLTRTVTPYEDDPKQFKADMRKLAKDLEAVGL